MSEGMSLGLALLVEHGREQEAADFYAAAFGGEPSNTYQHEGQLWSPSTC